MQRGLGSGTLPNRRHNPDPPKDRVQNTEIFLVVVGLFAGIIDAIAGGGGLIALPAMSLVVGPGLDAIGSNKLASFACAAIAFLVYLWRGHVEWRSSTLFTVAVGAGALAGSFAARFVPVDAFPWLLALTCPVIVYAVWKKDLWLTRPVQQDSPSLWAIVIAGIVVGFYDGIWGPGGGTFMFLALMLFARLPLLASLAASKLANSAAAAVALVIYGSAGHVHLREAMLLAAGMLTGGFVGAMLASANASRVVRPALIVVAVLLTAKVIATYA
ncbi:MAG: sulfite exporter TauE/SafE family protein [Gemmatimonadaceae bacterium]|nr:sulfite exporter TauE/SafE family protein [Gemmatimonadaceae bacterium]